MQAECPGILNQNKFLFLKQDVCPLRLAGHTQMALATPQGRLGHSATALNVPCFTAFLAEWRSAGGVFAECLAIQMVETAVFHRTSCRAGGVRAECRCECPIISRLV